MLQSGGLPQSLQFPAHRQGRRRSLCWGPSWWWHRAKAGPAARDRLTLQDALRLFPDETHLAMVSLEGNVNVTLSVLISVSCWDGALRPQSPP